MAISVNGDSNPSKSLVLVLLSHYPMSWTLDVPSGVIIEKVLLVSVHDHLLLASIMCSLAQ